MLNLYGIHGATNVRDFVRKIYEDIIPLKLIPSTEAIILAVDISLVTEKGQIHSHVLSRKFSESKTLEGKAILI